MSDHSLLSPSGAPGWIRCAGKLAMEADMPDQSTEFADEGTAAHTLAAWCLTEKKDALAYKGRRIEVGHRTFEVTDDMAEHVQTYVDAIYERIEQFRARGAVAVDMLTEVRVDFSEYVGHRNQKGTSDVVLLVEWWNGTGHIDVNDLKFGRGVKVYAEDNEQMKLYALGAYNEFAMLCDATTISMAIHQPRVHHFDDWETDIESLLKWANEPVKPAAKKAIQVYELKKSGGIVPLEALTPGEKQCRFCRAKGHCQAAAQHALNIVADDFVDLTRELEPQIGGAIERVQNSDNANIAECMANLDFIESWCKAVRSRAESELLAGHEVPNYKLVQGKKGSRRWSDEQQAEEEMKRMRLKQAEMYDYKLISPTAAEKLLAKTLPKKWATLQSFITQSDGGLSVAHVSDKRPAVVVAPTADDFDDVSNKEDLA